MQKRNFTPQCIVITFVTCFLLFHPPIKNQPIQSTAWAGNTEWSDAFSSSPEKSSPAAQKPATYGNSRNKRYDNQSNSPDSYNQPSTKRNQYEKPDSYQSEVTTSHPQIQEKSVQTASKQVSDTEAATTAEELLTLFNLPAIIANTSEKSIELLIKQSPDAKTYADIFREFGKRYLTWENLKKPMIKRYTETFTNRELQQLKTFFSSATGKKYIQKSNTLMQETTLDIQKTILSYQEDLKRMIVEKELGEFKKQN